jgi:AtzE family amidohydrolase
MIAAVTHRSAIAIADAVRTGTISAERTCEDALAKAERLGPERSGFLHLLNRRALARAREIDAKVAKGIDPGPLAGVPFGAAEAFDVSGKITTAGSRTRLDARFASRDAKVIALLEDAGAVLIGTQNMDEFGYGFTTINEHFGTSRNPFDPDRVAGGGAGGSAVSVAAGVVPISLAFDINGSLRVPAALCGVIGFKPTYSDLPTEGYFHLVESLDVVGTLGRDLDDLALVRTLLREGRPEAAVVPQDRPILFGRLMSWFDRNIAADMREPLDRFWAKVGRVSFQLDHSEVARAAASVIIAAEGASLHRTALETRPLDFEPPVRDRLLAGLVLPSDDYLRAQRFRNWIQVRARSQFTLCDILFTPATPGAAPLIADPMMEFDGAAIPARSHLGIYTQPISLMGLPAIVLPLAGDRPMPLGIQLIAAAGAEATLFAAARQLIDEGLCAMPEAPTD